MLLIWIELLNGCVFNDRRISIQMHEDQILVEVTNFMERDLKWWPRNYNGSTCKLSVTNGCLRRGSWSLEVTSVKRKHLINITSTIAPRLPLLCTAHLLCHSFTFSNSSFTIIRLQSISCFSASKNCTTVFCFVVQTLSIFFIGSSNVKSSPNPGKVNYGIWTVLWIILKQTWFPNKFIKYEF